jgi:hypothetical protein
MYQQYADTTARYCVDGNVNILDDGELYEARKDEIMGILKDILVD